MIGKSGNSNSKSTSNGASLEVCNIALGTTIEGTVKVEANIRLEGIIHGTVTCSGRIVISASGFIHGDIVCKNIVSEGKVEGNIVAKEKIHLLPTASVTGNMKYKTLQIDAGAAFDGQAICAPSTPSTKKTEVASKNA